MCFCNPNTSHFIGWNVGTFWPVGAADGPYQRPQGHFATIQPVSAGVPTLDSSRLVPESLRPGGRPLCDYVVSQFDIILRRVMGLRFVQPECGVSLASRSLWSFRCLIPSHHYRPEPSPSPFPPSFPPPQPVALSSTLSLAPATLALTCLLISPRPYVPHDNLSDFY